VRRFQDRCERLLTVEDRQDLKTVYSSVPRCNSTDPYYENHPLLYRHSYTRSGDPDAVEPRRPVTSMTQAADSAIRNVIDEQVRRSPVPCRRQTRKETRSSEVLCKRLEAVVAKDRSAKSPPERHVKPGRQDRHATEILRNRDLQAPHGLWSGHRDHALSERESSWSRAGLARTPKKDHVAALPVSLPCSRPVSEKPERTASSDPC